MAVGTMSGALLSARRPVPGVVLMAVSAGAFGLSVAVAAVMPSPVLFGVVLFFVGLAALTFMTASNSMMQLTRSEEHTSELQSLMRISDAVFCLKKKTEN